MDRLQIKCILSTGQADLQLDIKKFPDEKGPCFMITQEGLFKGYIGKQRNGSYTIIGASSFSDDDLQSINDALNELRARLR
jgi:hypothetical protein